MKKLIALIITLAVLCVGVYFGFSFYISQMTKDLVETAWDHEDTIPEEYEDVVPNLYTYRQLDWLNKVSSAKTKAVKEELSYPTTQWRFNTATTTYYYTITDKSTGVALTGCNNVKCTIEWEYTDGKWVIKSFDEE